MLFELFKKTDAQFSETLTEHTPEVAGAVSCPGSDLTVWTWADHLTFLSLIFLWCDIDKGN